MELIAFGVAGVLSAGLLVWRRRQRWSQMASQIREARAATVRPSPYRRAGPADGELIGLLAAAREYEQALRERGFTDAGDLVAARSNGTVQVVRVLLDPAHPTAAMISMWPNRPTLVRVSLESYTDDGERVTTVGPRPPMIATPPATRQQLVDRATPMADVIARHRVFTADTALRPLLDLAGLQAELERAYEQLIAWREAQPEHELLDADLRAILRDQYSRYGPALLARLGARLPPARARRARR